MKKIKKIVYVSGTRADYGLMKPVLETIKKQSRFQLQIYATGMHLMKRHGNSIEIVKKYYPSTQSINASFLSDNKSSMTYFASRFINLLTKEFEKDKPDFVLTLGDRIEMLATALVCQYLGIATGQVHAGDKTTTVDEPTRHAITKLSHIFFAATKDAAIRLKKLGEDPWRIHLVGAPSLDVIKTQKLYSRKEICQIVSIDPSKKFLLLLQHPISESVSDASKQIYTTLQAVKSFDMPAAVIYPNADPGGHSMIEVIEKERSNPLFRIFPSLDHVQFLALANEASVWIGNSSAAIIESASLKTPVVNVGDRQKGRVQAKNVINVGYSKQELIRAIKKSLTDNNYLRKIKKINNPWGDGKTGNRITNILKTLKIDYNLLSKQIAY